MSERPVRTRFAPSPTGPLHIGGVRTALFSWLLARHHGGQFVLRIEDTDQNRFTEGSLEMIYDALKWAGIDWDEGPDVGGPYGPYVQSERKAMHQEWAQWLIDHDKAYKCYCSKERLDQVNAEKQANGEPPGYDRHCRNLTPEQRAEYEAQGIKPVVRLKVPLEGEVIGHDLLRGEVRFENSTLQDAVMLKGDGFPTYHLAHVVDDHFMEISHVTRANEWLPSLPLHIHLWHAFGWEVPVYVHLPVLLNPNGQGKLSKRHAAFDQNGQKILVLAKEYIEAGYYPEAVVNFLTNIGWNFGDEREVFSVKEAIERFDISRVQVANSAFPLEKLDWLNGVWIRERLTPDEIAANFRAPLENAGLKYDESLARKVAPLVQTRIKTFNDVVDIAGFFFADHSAFKAAPASDIIQKKMDAASTKRALEASIAALEKRDAWTTEALQTLFVEMAQELGLSNSQLFGALRVAITAQKISTPTFETMEVLGKDETIRRLKLSAEALA